MNASAIKFDGENRYIRITDIDESSSKYKPEFPVSPNGQLIDKYLVSENDILFARTGASTGKSYLYNKDDGKLYFAGFLIRAKIKEEFNSYFVFTQTKTIQYYKWVQLMSMRSGQPGINSQEYASYSFNIPSKNEQDKIASFLLLLDERISTQRKIIRDLNVLKTTITKRIFSEQLKFKDDGGNDFPKWKRKTLGELGEFLGGGTPTSSNSDFWNGNIPWVSSSDLFENDIHTINITRFITENAINNSATKLCKAPLILIVSRVGVGKVAYFEKSLCTSQDFLNMNNFNCNGIFLTYLLSVEMKKTASGTQGTSIKGISTSDIKSKQILLPCITEQNKIAIFLKSIDEKINLESDLFSQYENQKKYLLKKLFV